jgi:signal transduction histidine kinase
MTSHEFRTPLATILSSAELLRYYGDRLPAEEKLEIVGSIEGAVKRMTQMLDSVLMIGRADSGNLEFSPVPCKPHALSVALATEAARAASADGSGVQRLDMHFPSVEAELMLDEKLLRHILGNLIGNAFKYSPADGRVRLEFAVDDREVVFVVADRGIGIPAEDMPRLFETFHRAGNVGNISGTGLGLAIVKRAVELHGGSMDVESMVGGGTRFSVRLPRVEV